MLLKAERLKAEQLKAGRTARVALALSLALAACGGSSTDDAAIAPEDAAAATATVTQVPTTPAPVASSVVATTDVPATTVTAEPTVEEIEAEIIAAYIQGWDDFYTALENPEMDTQYALATHAQAAYKILVADQLSVRNDGRRVEWPADSKRDHSPQILELTEASAIIRDCFVNDAYGIYSDGRIVNDELATSIWSVQMVLEDGRWKTGVTERLARELGVWDCE